MFAPSPDGWDVDFASVCAVWLLCLHPNFEGDWKFPHLSFWLTFNSWWYWQEYYSEVKMSNIHTMLDGIFWGKSLNFLSPWEVSRWHQKFVRTSVQSSDFSIWYCKNFDINYPVSFTNTLWVDYLKLLKSMCHLSYLIIIMIATNAEWIHWRIIKWYILCRTSFLYFKRPKNCVCVSIKEIKDHY